jgi:hypothetical protein
MLKRALLTATLVMGIVGAIGAGSAEAAHPGQPADWERFYYYPYVYYPHNFQQYPESYDHLYYRYPNERRIPVYNASWHNFYPSKHPYHMGHHFILDVF